MDRQPLVPSGAAYFDSGIQAKGTKRFVFVLCPSFTLLAFSSAVEPLRIANQLSQKPLYSWTVVSMDGQPVSSSSGIAIHVDSAFSPPARDDVLVVCAGNQPAAAGDQQIVAAVRGHYRNSGQVGGLCTGAVALAFAGVLEGRKFTLHWENQPAFIETFPELAPTLNKYEIDDRVMTSGGGAAATDLFLDIVASDHGQRFAAVVSDMCLRRVTIGRDMPQRSSLAAVAQVSNPALSAMVELMKQNREDPMPLDDIAERVGLSRRQMERLFGDILGMPPARFYLNLRLEHARNLLASTEMSLWEVSVACGFSSKHHFSKVFTRRFGTTPGRVKKRK